MNALIDDLKSSIAGPGPRPLVICGAGVSVAASAGDSPNWKQLIASGIQRVIGLQPDEQTWSAYALHRLNQDDAAVWVEVADELTARLGGRDNAEFRLWLEKEFKALTPTDTLLLDAIASLNCPIATTSYDDLLAKSLDLPVINWDDHEEVHQFLANRSEGILHLHGYWKKPSTVILGSRSYRDAVDDSRRTFLQQLAALSRPSVFIGASPQGLADPDFSNLSEFIAEWEGVADRRYWLVRDEGVAHKVDHRARIYPVVYGTEFSQLPEFLRSLVPTRAAQLETGVGARCIDQHEPNPVLFGRTEEVEQIALALLANKTAIIAGAPGIGKTAVAVAALYHEQVVQAFGRRRVFVSAEAANDARSMVSRLAESLGLPASGEEASLLRLIEIAAQDQPVAGILDNVEGIFDADWEDAHRILRLMSQIRGLSLVLTIRGTPPVLPGSKIIEDLPKLEHESARNAFLAVAGSAFAADPDLDPLLGELDGHALSLQLVGARSAGLPSLSSVLASWQAAHAAILAHPSATEGRLTSVRVSVALSMKSPRLLKSPLSKRLLTLLAYLPAGLNPKHVPSVLGKSADDAQIADWIRPLHQLRLVERRTDGRLRMLTPLREAVKLDYKALPIDRERLFARILKLAESCLKLGRSDWAGQRDILEGEVGNLDSVCLEMVRRDVTRHGLLRALQGIEQLCSFSGSGTAQSIEVAVDAFVAQKRFEEAAVALISIGEINWYRDNRDRSLACFERALTYRPRKQAKARALFGLARVHGLNSAHPLEAQNLAAAMNLYEQINDRLGIANVLSESSLLFKKKGDTPEAIRLSRQALTIYEDIGGDLGVANSWVDLARLGDEDGIANLNKVILEFRNLGDASGEASAKSVVAEIDAKKGNNFIAESKFRDALAIYQNIGDISGKEITSVRLGALLLTLDKPNEASDHLRSAFAGYLSRMKTSDLTRHGWQALCSAFFAPDSESRKSALLVANMEWSRIERIDLVQEWVENEVWACDFQLGEGPKVPYS